MMVRVRVRVRARVSVRVKVKVKVRVRVRVRVRVSSRNPDPNLTRCGGLAGHFCRDIYGESGFSPCTCHAGTGNCDTLTYP